MGSDDHRKRKSERWWICSKFTGDHITWCAGHGLTLDSPNLCVQAAGAQTAPQSCQSFMSLSLVFLPTTTTSTTTTVGLWICVEENSDKTFMYAKFKIGPHVLENDKHFMYTRFALYILSTYTVLLKQKEKRESPHFDCPQCTHTLP